MRILILAISLTTLTGCQLQTSADTPFTPEPRSNPGVGAQHFVNGKWLLPNTPGIKFEAGTRYAVNGVFVAEPPANAEIIDLGGAWVVPPYGEAHNHSVDSKATQPAAQRYLDEGVYYFKNPNSIRSITQPHRAYWQQPDTLDVSFSFGGLSKDEGHPEVLYRRLSGFGLYPSVAADELDGEAFYDVETLDKLNEKWPKILASQPNFLKLYLLEHDQPTSDGLPPEVFREVVKRAKAAGLPTTVHVETVADLALAVDAGATEAAHLPAYNLRYAKDPSLSQIPDSLLQQMAQQQFVVVTTAHVSTSREYTASQYKTVSLRQVDNLKRMHAAGVPIAIGSDTFQQTAWNEVQTLRSLGAFDDTTLLKLWMQTPVLSIFPKRAIGQLKAGYEASFLVLDCNPAETFACAQKISAGFKQGLQLTGKP